MSKDFFKNKYVVGSPRYEKHDYSGGIYFITICTAQREHFFGEIKNATMHLSKIGYILEQEIGAINSHHPYAFVHTYTIMPNHLHLIIEIDKKLVPYKRRNNNEPKNMRDLNFESGWLSITISGLKSRVKKSAKKNGVQFNWQARFYDHIIRTEQSYKAIYHYIQDNVANWSNGTKKI